MSASSVDEAARLFELRTAAVSEFAAQAEAVAHACHLMAVRFHRGGKLVVFGVGGPSTDAQHVAVEFVHPVIVGKRALPAISLTTDVATVTGVAAREGLEGIFAHQIRYLAEPTDIALGISSDGNSPSVLAGLQAAHQLGLLTIALAGEDGGAEDGRAEDGRADGGSADGGSAEGGRAEGGREGGVSAIASSPAVDHLLLARSADPRIVKEIQVTMYHVLWELVHVFFEQPGLLAPEAVA
jgi:D-sedoheptulose 7-phosphate isomerase